MRPHNGKGMGRLPALLAVVVVAVACQGPSGSGGNATKTPAGASAVLWTGTPKPATSGGDSSPHLSEQLGGYSLTLRDDGSFEADWRGLKFDGKYVRTAGKLTLSPVTVLGQTREESVRAKSGDALFEPFAMAVSSDGSRLTLESRGPEGQDVVFTLGPPK